MAFTAKEIALALARAANDPLCRVVIEGSSDDNGNRNFDVLNYVLESKANKFRDEWKTSGSGEGKTGYGVITLEGVMGSISVYPMNVFSIKITHMT